MEDDNSGQYDQVSFEKYILEIFTNNYTRNDKL